MNPIIFSIAGLYLLVSFFVWLGLWKKGYPSRGTRIATGSLVICARDEEKELPACLQSLEEQKVEPQRLEVILVDDASRDGTGVLMDEYARRSRYSVRVLHMSASQPGEATGKWRPLKEGIKLSRNEGLLLTDADAILSPDWVHRHLEELSSSQMVAGFARIEGRDLWGHIQGLDWFFLLGVGSSLASWGIPQAALGKNLSLRRSDYDAIGGLEGIGFSLTEDLSLVQAIVRRGGRLHFPLDKDLLVSTPRVRTWTDFLQQRQRWATGIRRLKPLGKICIGVMALRHFGVILGILSGAPEALWAWAATAAMNFLILFKVTSKLGAIRRLWTFPFWEIFYTWTAPILAIRFFSNRSVQWKGRSLRG